MRYWVTSTIPLRPTPGSYRKIMDIPQYQIVEALDAPIVQTDYGAIKIDWMKISYREFEGWAYTGRLELYVGSSDLVQREIPAPDYRPHQNIIWEGREKFNLCGQFCVTWIAEEVSIEEFLRKWKAKDSRTFGRIVPGDNVTNVNDLHSMIGVYPGYNAVSYELTMTDPVLNRILFTPRRLQAQVSNSSFPILSVNINKSTGNIQSSGNGHWVVVTGVDPSGVNRAVVSVFNPYVNQFQQYSWKEIESSIGYVPLGTIIKTSGE